MGWSSSVAPVALKMGLGVLAVLQGFVFASDRSVAHGSTVWGLVFGGPGQFEPVILDMNATLTRLWQD